MSSIESGMSDMDTKMTEAHTAGHVDEFNCACRRQLDLEIIKEELDAIKARLDALEGA